MAKMVEWLRENDSEECAVWWEKFWTPFRDPRRGAYTLADCGYVSCTHQNSQEGKWRPVKRGTGCGAKGDERQGLGSFMSRLVDYIHESSAEHETSPNSFIRDPVPVKGEWDAVQDLDPRILNFCFPMNLSQSVYCLCIEPMPSQQESASQPTTGTKGGLDGPGEDADFTSSQAGRRRRQAPASQPTRAGQLQEADDDFTPSKLSRPGRARSMLCIVLDLVLFCMLFCIR